MLFDGTGQTAVKDIAALLARAGIDDLFGTAKGAAASAERDEPKEMDVVAVRALLCALGLGPFLVSIVICMH